MAPPGSKEVAPREIAVIGGGPAGLMAAEVLAEAGLAVTLYEALPSPGRKLLMAGRGGLNLTHSEESAAFLARYGEAAGRLAPALAAYPPAALVAWCEGLGQETFVGSSGRIFPKALKASPLLRAWLARLRDLGVTFRPRHRWLGWDAEGALRFATPDGEVQARPAATLLALGGASWPRLGSDGAWVPLLRALGCEIAPLRPANCGFVVGWSDHFRERFEGQPLKPLGLAFAGQSLRGEAVVTAAGLEGGGLYALSRPLREAIARDGAATLTLDLRPHLTTPELARRLAASPGAQSLSTRLRKAAGLPPLAVALLREVHGTALPAAPAALATAIKSLPLRLTAPAPLDRAISTAGGIAWDELDETYMLKRKPGVFLAGEMLDWEAPTGGYLLQGCMSTGRAAAVGVMEWAADAVTRRGDQARDGSS